MGLVDDLLQAKKNHGYAPLLLIQWPRDGYVILREPHCREVEFFSQLLRQLPAQAASSIVRECLLTDTVGIFTRPEFGYLHTCARLLTQWGGDQTSAINTLLETARPGLTSLADLLASKIRLVSKNVPFAELEAMTYSQLLRAELGAERMVSEISGNDQPPFRLTNPELEAIDKRAAEKRKQQEIIDGAAAAEELPDRVINSDILAEIEQARRISNWRAVRPPAALRAH